MKCYDKLFAMKMIIYNENIFILTKRNYFNKK